LSVPFWYSLVHGKQSREEPRSGQPVTPPIFEPET